MRPSSTILKHVTLDHGIRAVGGIRFSLPPFQGSGYREDRTRSCIEQQCVPCEHRGSERYLCVLPSLLSTATRQPPSVQSRIHEQTGEGPEMPACPFPPESKRFCAGHPTDLGTTGLLE